MKDYYSILGVAKKASADDIKKAYRRLAHKLHPDKESGDEERFKEINEAYYVLSDNRRRHQYDQFGVGPGAQAPRGASGDFSGFAEGFDSWFSDIMEQFFGAEGAGGTRRSSRGRDIAVELTVTLEQAFSGIKEELSVMRWVSCDRCQGGGGEPGTSLKTCTACSGAGRLHRVEQTFFGAMTRVVRCPECQGSGEVPENPCTTCKSSGRIRKQDRVSVSLPAGMEEGDTFMVDAGGDVPQVPRAGKPGSLYVTVRVAPHARFRRESEDLWVDEDASFFVLLRGGTTTLKGIDEQSIRLKIPTGTASGKVFRVKGHGMPRRKRGGGRGDRGDLYVTVHARIPQKPSQKLLDALGGFADEL